MTLWNGLIPTHECSSFPVNDCLSTRIIYTYTFLPNFPCSLRLLLHKGAATDNQKWATQSEQSENRRLNTSQTFVEKLLEDSLSKLQEENTKQDNCVRWELGACWIQHLQDQKNTEKDKKPSAAKAKNDMKVEGLGTPLRSLRNKKSEGISQVHSDKEPSNSSSADVSSTEAQSGTSHSESELALKRILSDAAFTRLKESDTGLHQKVVFLGTHKRIFLYFISCGILVDGIMFGVQSLQELIDLSQKYYDDVALPKLVLLNFHIWQFCDFLCSKYHFYNILYNLIQVADFGSLELSPVDGRTLTDFMHTRGLRMNSLGRVVSSLIQFAVALS